jgi:protein involved in polysaccharide export with SLBB domain
MVMTKLKTAAVCLSLIGLGAVGAILAAPQDGSKRPSPATFPGPRAVSKAGQSSAPTNRPAAKKVQPALHTLEDYVIEPPDLLIVEVLEALPGRPISGERLVRPDGKISLGFYGEIYVAGLTLPEIKEKIVLHLRKSINDDVLGLVERDLDTGDYKRDKDGRVIVLDPRETDRVFVDVTAYNSKDYYVQGAVRSPGRIPNTGHDTVLDALSYAGGLSPRADHDNVILYRKAKDGTLQRLPIDVDQITMGDDPTTNYQILPGDRLVIPAKPGAGPAEDALDDRPAAGRAPLEPPGGDRRASREAATVRDLRRDVEAPRRGDAADVGLPIRSLERRLGDVERKLDRILEALEHPERK